MPANINTVNVTIQTDNSSLSGWDTTDTSSNIQWKPSSMASGSGLGSSGSTDQCGHPTLDGASCELPPSFDDGHCHWHTSEQCYHPTDDGSPCELPGSQDDGRCHIHTNGCNESLTHDAVEKACYHGLKYPYRMLGLHNDTVLGRSPLEIMPESAARVAAEVGKGILEVLGEEYDREESHEYYRNNVVEEELDDPSKIEKLFSSVFKSDPEEEDLEVLKAGIERMWEQVDKKEHHADACRTAIAAAEIFLGKEVQVE